MKIKILFFAHLEEMFGCKELISNLNQGATLGDVIDNLSSAEPKLSSIPVKYAINEKFSCGNETLQENDVIALLPPMSGG